MRFTHVRKDNKFTREKEIERTPISVTHIGPSLVLYQFYRGNRFVNGAVSRKFFDAEYMKYHAPRQPKSLPQHAYGQQKGVPHGQKKAA